jgi:hypothetical protein
MIASLLWKTLGKKRISGVEAFDRIITVLPVSTGKLLQQIYASMHTASWLNLT